MDGSVVTTGDFGQAAQKGEQTMSNDAARAIAPPVDMPERFESIVIHKTQAEFRTEHGSVYGMTEIRFDAYPTPRVVFSMKPNAGDTFKVAMNQIVGRPEQEPTLISDSFIGPQRVQLHRSDGYELYGRFEEPVTESLQAVESVSWIVVNGPEAFGEPICDDNHGWLGRHQLTVGDWELIIDRRPADKGNRVPYKITHVIKCRRKDASTFHVDDVQRVGTVLFRAMSFAKGRWIGLVGPWGEVSERAVWFKPENSKVSLGASSYTWFPTMERSALADVYSVMWECWDDEPRRETLITAMHWYVEACLCAGGIEGSVLLIQSALETVAWHVITEERKICSRGGFEPLPAADKLRWLLSIYGIDCSIPSHTTAIEAYARAFNHIGDMVDVLVEVRNALTHGTPKKVARVLSRPQGDEERWDLWWYALGLLEKAILAVLGYNGRILYREDKGGFPSHGKAVPWASGCDGEYHVP